MTGSDSATVVIQARMGSSRLPGKTLTRLGDRLVIDWVVERVASADGVADVVVATSTNAEDDAIADHLHNGPVRVVRGHPTDVLERYVMALAEVGTERVVRVTADCPFVEPELLSMAIGVGATVEYASTGHDGRYPRGLDLEVVTGRALRIADAEATDPVEREHVTPFIVRRPERFSSVPIVSPPWARRPDLRITLDEPADLDLLRRVVDELGASPESLHARDALQLLADRPDLAAINSAVEHRNVR